MWEENGYDAVSRRQRRSQLRNLPIITIGLILINVAVYLVLEAMGSTENGLFMYEHGALYPASVLQEGEYWRLFTAAFLHFGASHLMNNMLSLFVLGEHLERVLGRVKYLVIYLISGVGANIVTVWYYSFFHIDALSAGASGAIMGIAGALFGVILRRRRSVDGIGRRQMLILIGFSLYSGYVSGSTNNVAHLSGLAFGFLMGYLMGQVRIPKYSRNVF